MKTETRAPARAYAATILAHTFWGLSYLASRAALDRTHVLILLSHRFVLAFLSMQVPLLLGRASLNLRRRGAFRLLILGLTEPVAYYFAEQYGLLHSNTVFSGVMVAMIPILSALLAVPVLRERVTLRQLLFSALSVAGVVGIGLMTKSSGSLDWIGVAALVAAVAAAAVYTLLSRSIRAEFTPFTRTWVMMAVGAAVFSAAAGLQVRSDPAAYLRPLADGTYLLALAFLGVGCSCLSYFLSGYAISRMPVAQETVFANLTTVVSVAAGVLFLHEPFSAAGFAFCVMILLGIWGVQRYASEHK